MKWRTAKTSKKPKARPFLVLPLIEVDNAEAAATTARRTMKRKPANLRLFAKPQNITSPPKANDENARPLTATLDKPQVLDIRLITKIDMSLVRKEFLCITNLCRLPKARRKPAFAVQKRHGTATTPRPSILPGAVQKASRPGTGDDSWEDETSSSSQTPTAAGAKKQQGALPRRYKMIRQTVIESAPARRPSKKPEPNDSNNNNNRSGSRSRSSNFDTFRVPKKRMIVPEPCTACGRPDHPERFHSHPETSRAPPKKPDAPKSSPSAKTPVQKPVAMRYKSRAAEKDGAKAASPKRASSAKGPRTLTCYVCGREFGTMSLPLHEPKCLERWDRENANLPPEMRRKRPVKPERVLNREDYNNYAWEASKANLVPCKNCKRTFYPDRLEVHLRSCKSTQPLNMSKVPKKEKEEPPPNTSTPLPIPNQNRVICSVCGRLFFSKSIKIHEKQCLKKWHLQNDHLPPSKREPMYSETAQAETAKKPSPPETPANNEEESEENKNKPPMFPCYLCGRLFSVHSIYKHEPQCLKKWNVENDKLPPNKRQPVPIKPDIKFTRSGKVDHRAMADANWRSHLDQLIPCKNCGRTFNPDRVSTHESLCKGYGRVIAKDVKLETYRLA